MWVSLLSSAYLRKGMSEPFAFFQNCYRNAVTLCDVPAREQPLSLPRWHRADLVWLKLLLCLGQAGRLSDQAKPSFSRILSINSSADAQSHYQIAAEQKRAFRKGFSKIPKAAGLLRP